MKKILLITLLIASTLSACGGGPTQTPPVPAPVKQTESPPTPVPAETETALPASTEPSAPASGTSFTNDVLPIFNASCVKCHGGEQVKEGLDLTAYDKLMAGSFNGSVITPGDPANSFLVKQVMEGKMPKRGSKLTAEQIQIISNWVAEGALNN